MKVLPGRERERRRRRRKRGICVCILVMHSYAIVGPVRKNNSKIVTDERA